MSVSECIDTLIILRLWDLQSHKTSGLEVVVQKKLSLVWGLSRILGLKTIVHQEKITLNLKISREKVKETWEREMVWGNMELKVKLSL